MSKKQSSITMLKLVLIISLIVGVGVISGISGYTLIRSKVLVQSAVAQEKIPNKNSVPEWGHKELPKNIPVDAQLNIKKIIFDYGIIISILTIVYGVIKFILAVRKKDERKKHKAQKIIIYGSIILALCIFLLFPKSIVL